MKDNINNEKTTLFGSNQEIIYNFATHILDKRYELYCWIETKINLLLLINTVLASICYFLIYESIEFVVPLVPNFLIFAAMIFLFASIIQCLVLIIPKMKSPIWKTKDKEELIVKQIRSSIGIEEFTPEEYREKFRTLDFNTIIDMNVDQIKKMNSIIIAASNGIRRGAIWTVFASFLIFICIIFILI